MIRAKADRHVMTLFKTRSQQSRLLSYEGNMKRTLSLIALIVSASFVFGQSQNPAPASPAAPAPQTSCSKVVSFAVAEGGQPVPAIPKFAQKWLESKAPRQHYGNLCFSQIPSAGLPSYLVVFSTTETAFQGLTPTAHTYTTETPGHANQSAMSSSGGTWAYGYTGGMPPASTDTLSLRKDDKPKVLDVRAYDQNGKTITTSTLAQISNREKLLEHVLSDISADTPHPVARGSVTSPFPVYYVNCDPDAPMASPQPNAAAKMETASAAPPKPVPPPDPQLDIWSNPGGADIFVDGSYVGKTPFTMNVTQGEHTITLRKKDFGVWSRKVTSTTGKRNVGAYLEQKVLTLQ
jgi:PEGA domain